MFDFVYQFLSKIGYTHPIHPTEVHMPIGLVVGSLVFALTSLLFRRPKLAEAARYCTILAFIWIFPTILLGYMDWQHFYAGAELPPIKIKLILAPVLAVLLLIAILLGRKYGATSRLVLLSYICCFLTVVVLGYFGGQMVYGGRPEAAASKDFTAGQSIFEVNCKSCHPGGGNILKPNLPIKGAPELADSRTFVSYIRKPVMPDGSKGIMPPFNEAKISDARAEELYLYITNVLAKPQG